MSDKQTDKFTALLNCVVPDFEKWETLENYAKARFSEGWEAGVKSLHEFDGVSREEYRKKITDTRQPFPIGTRVERIAVGFSAHIGERGTIILNSDSIVRVRWDGGGESESHKDLACRYWKEVVQDDLFVGDRIEVTKHHVCHKVGTKGKITSIHGGYGNILWDDGSTSFVSTTGTWYKKCGKVNL